MKTLAGKTYKKMNWKKIISWFFLYHKVGNEVMMPYGENLKRGGISQEQRDIPGTAGYPKTGWSRRNLRRWMVSLSLSFPLLSSQLSPAPLPNDPQEKQKFINFSEEKEKSWEVCKTKWDTKIQDKIHLHYLNVYLHYLNVLNFKSLFFFCTRGSTFQ